MARIPPTSASQRTFEIAPTPIRIAAGMRATISDGSSEFVVWSHRKSNGTSRPFAENERAPTEKSIQFEKIETTSRIAPSTQSDQRHRADAEATAGCTVTPRRCCRRRRAVLVLVLVSTTPAPRHGVVSLGAGSAAPGSGVVVIRPSPCSLFDPVEPHDRTSRAERARATPGRAR